MESYHALRRKEKEIRDQAEMKAVLAGAKYVTVAMCRGDEPYLVTLSHGYDEKKERHLFPLRPRGEEDRDPGRQQPRLGPGASSTAATSTAAATTCSPASSSTAG